MTLLEPPVSAISPVARAAAASLRVLSRASFPVLLVALARAADPPLTTEALAQGVAALVLAPELCARLVLRAFAAEVEVAPAALVVSGELRRIEVPTASIARARAWRVALPGAGLWLAMRSGVGLPFALAAREIEPLIAALARAGISAQPDAALAYLRARETGARRWWDRPAVAIGLASLLPASVAFYAHQHIAFGGLLGEYYLMGLGAWLATAFHYELTSALYLLLWCGCFRIAAELCAWGGAFATPAHAARVRRIAQRSAALLYYASIPSLLALRFLA